MPEPDWTIVFYTDGRSDPVREFIDRLDPQAQVRIRAAIQELRIRNVQAKWPLVDHIEGKSWELRRDSGRGAYRVLYFTFSGKRIVLLHGFQKKTRATPRREIAVAQDRHKRFVEREGGTP